MLLQRINHDMKWRAWLVFGVLVLATSYGAWSQEVETLSPAPGDVIGWGHAAPTIQIQAVLKQNRQPTLKPRQFMTANIKDRHGKLVDRVALYDDGTHTDLRTGDGTFTAIYYPLAPGEYLIQIRVQWQEGAKSKEAWAKDTPFYLEYVPYAHIVYPEPGGQTGLSTTLRARLLLNGEPYEKDEPTLKTEVRIVSLDEKVNEILLPEGAERRGTLLVAPLSFPSRGTYEVRLYVSTDRRDVTLHADPAACQVKVASPPTTLLWIGGALILGYLILPPKKAVPLYTHKITIKDTNSGRTITNFEVKPNKLEKVSCSVGGQNCNQTIDEVNGTLCVLDSMPGEKSLTVNKGDSGSLMNKSNLQISSVIKPDKDMAFRVGEYEFYYISAEATGRHTFLRFLPTPGKVISGILGIAALAYGWYQYSQFFQQ
jgi:hypothetical protein